MRVTVVGSSPAWPNPGSAHAGYLVETAAGRLLVDCGPGVLSRLREDEPWPSVDAIAITHVHLDHCGDLVPWLWGLVMGPAQGREPIPLWLPPGARSALEELTGPGMLDRGFAVREYAESVAFDVADLRIEPVRLRHFAVDAFGLRVDAAGTLACFSGDTGETDAVVRLARDADLLVIEATLADDDPDAVGGGHLSARQALDYARQAGARRALLTHRPDELPAPDGAEVAFDGLVVDL